MVYNLDFLTDDIKNGLLKINRVGMIRRTMKINGGKIEKSFIYLPMIKNFIVLNVCDRFKIKKLQGRLKQYGEL